MNEAENKVKEYIERASRLHDSMATGRPENNELLMLAQMLQKEEHYQDNLIHWQESTAGVTIDESTIQKSIDKLKD